jgi:hypothetical protein
MWTFQAEPLKRPADLNLTDIGNPLVLYVRSYLLIRTVIGAIGLLLPIVLAVADYFFVAKGIAAKGFVGPSPSIGGWGLIHVRGSISAYYHSAVGDLFVAGLSVVGLLLMTYMGSQRRTPDFILSTVAGATLLGVVFFPTGRPIPAGDPTKASLSAQTPAPCGQTTFPTPPNCAPVQTFLGENVTAGVHFFCAAVFILSLAWLCFIFAHRLSVDEPTTKWQHVHRTCGRLILVAVLWVGVGHLLKMDIFGLTPLYVGELVSVWSFAMSWLLKGESLSPLVRTMRRGVSPKLPQKATTSARPPASPV